MTELLVSVRNASEAEIALAGGAELVDVKEPTRGPLGAADAATIRAVAVQVAGRAPVSAALGEVGDGNLLDASLASHVRYAKFGLAGCLGLGDWTERWKAAIDALPRGVTSVAVAYADWRVASAPEPWDVLARARSLGCGAVLVDTFDKSGGPLPEHLAPAELARFVSTARGQGLVCVVAGRLGPAQIEEILPLAPDYVAVRGAACRGDRNGRLDVERVRSLANLVRGWRPRGAVATG